MDGLEKNRKIIGGNSLHFGRVSHPRFVKLFILIVLVTLTGTSCLRANLGDDETQLEARYGKPLGAKTTDKRVMVLWWSTDFPSIKVPSN